MLDPLTPDGLIHNYSQAVSLFSGHHSKYMLSKLTFLAGTPFSLMHAKPLLSNLFSTCFFNSHF